MKWNEKKTWNDSMEAAMASNGFVYIFALKWVFYRKLLCYYIFLLNLDTGKNVYTQQAVYARYARQSQYAT